MVELKLYYLNPNDYGDEWFTIAENKEQALKNIIKSIEKEMELDDAMFNKFHLQDIKWISKINPSDQTTFSGKYTLDEYKNGGVIRSELA